MQLPEPAEQVRTAPIKVLRAIFAGIGQLLLAADRFREESEDLVPYDLHDPFRAWDYSHAHRPAAGAAGAAGAADGGQGAGAGSDQEGAEGQAAADADRTPQRAKPAGKTRAGKAPAGKAPAGSTPAGKAPARKAPAATTRAGKGKPATRRGAADGPEKTAAGRAVAGKTGAGKVAAGKRDSARKSDSAAKSGTAAKARRPPTTNGDTTTMRAGRARRPRQEVEPRRFRSLDTTGNVRLLSPEDLAEMAAKNEPAAAGQMPAIFIPEAGTGVPGWTVSQVEQAALPEQTASQANLTVDGPPESEIDQLEPAGRDWPGPAASGLPEAAPSGLPEAAPSGLPEAAPSLEPEPVTAPIAGYEALSLASLRARLRHLDVAQVRGLLDYEQATARREDVVGMFERRIAKLGASVSDAT